jgi:hypothetical protein
MCSPNKRIPGLDGVKGGVKIDQWGGGKVDQWRCRRSGIVGEEGV